MNRALPLGLAAAALLYSAGPVHAQTPGAPPANVTVTGMSGGLGGSAGISLGSLSMPVPGSSGVGSYGTQGGGAPAPPLCPAGDSGTHTVDAGTLNLLLKTGGGAPDYSSLGKTAGQFLPPSSYNGFPVEFANTGGAVDGTTKWTAAVDPRTIATNQMAIPAIMKFVYTCSFTACPPAASPAPSPPPPPPTNCGPSTSKPSNQKYTIDFQTPQPVVIAPALPAIPPPPAFNVTGTADSIVLGWNKGSANTLPAAKTFVHVPSCAFVTGADTPPVGNWGNVFASETANPSGGTDFVEYEVVISITAGPVVFNWDDGGATDFSGGGKDTATVLDTPPNGHPQYDAVAGVFPDAPGYNPCNSAGIGYHRYNRVYAPGGTGGRHITATKTFRATAEWYYNIGNGPVDGGALPCAGCNAIPVSWDFGTHPVEQIQGVPYFHSGG